MLRLVWVPIFTYVPRLLFRSVRERDPYPPWQAPDDHRVGRHPRRGVARRRARAALDLPGPRPDRLPHVRRHPRDARRPGTDAARRLLRALRLPRRRRRGARGREGADQGRARPRSRGSRSWPKRTGCATTPPSGSAARTGSGRTASGRGYDGVDEEASRGALCAVPAASPRAARGRARRRRRRCETTAIITEDVMHRVQRDIDLEDSRLDA